MAESRNGLTTALADRYKFDRELGRGGMATVYLALDLKHGRRVAIKVLRPELAASLGVERFLREITVTAQFNHPHILPLLDSGDVNGLLYYVMPYVDGESLRDKLDREKQLSLEDALRIAREVTDALEYAHRHGVIHRDIKPENILLEGRHAVVADFGIALALDVASEGKLTATGVAVGTPEYMSPEQAGGSDTLDERSDIYAVGCLLYEMLAGQPPFTGATVNSVIRQHLVADPRAIIDVRAAVPERVVRALQRALAKAPADRFATANEFGQALVVTPPNVTASPPSRGLLAGHRRVVVAVILAGLTGAIAGTAVLVQRGTTHLPKVAVVPLRNLSPDSAESYLSEAMHENLVSRIGMIPGLSVTSRSAVLGYRERPTPVRRIAKELGVDFVLEADFRKDSGRVDVTARLIDGRTETQLWVHSYQADQSVASLFDIQADIAGRLADALQVRISATVRGRLGDHPTESTAAYNLLFRASQLPFGVDPEANSAAEELLKQALALDPGVPAVLAALAQVYVLRAYNLGGSRSWADSGLALAMSAVKSDSTLFDGYDALGFLHLELGHLEHARAAYRKVLALRPSDGRAMLVLGWMEFLQGRVAEAVNFWAEARAVDPMNATVAGNMGLVELLFDDYERASRWQEVRRTLPARGGIGGFGGTRLLLLQGKPLEALRTAERQLADNPRSFQALSMAAAAAIGADSLERARQHLEQIDRSSADNWDFWGTTHRTSYAYVLSKLGEPERALIILHRTLEHGMRLIKEGDQRAGVRREIAAVHASLGHRDSAYQWLERAIAAGWRHETLQPSPLFEALREEPKFKVLMQRIDADLEQARNRVRRERLGPPLPSS